jgi:FtsP/CotA-like multicopper oxidase with cupredoxin domain
MAITPISEHRIVRRTIAGMEAMWAKMWDPPNLNPSTPDFVAPDDPVPTFMESQGLGTATTANTRTLQLMRDVVVTTWDNAVILEFMAFEDEDFTAAPAWPGPTLRVPRGKIFHCETGTSRGPHTIHWHGIEPTPMNDGVGHCSMELGSYTYQWQPNFIGTYFYHCHRNTVQHFEAGLYGMLLIEPPDAYDPAIPIIVGGPPKNVGGYPRRTAANLLTLPPAVQARFPAGHFVAGDATYGVGNADDTDVGHHHDFTIAYDVEALWVLAARDSRWNGLDHVAFYPSGANTNARGVVPAPQRPGVDDQFFHGFFHDYNADYWFVTGVPVPAAPGGTARISAGNTIPANLNSGVTGMQVDIRAQVNQTVLVRILNAAYNTAEVTFPVPVTIIAWDGRALGVPPFAKYNRAEQIPAGTPIRFSTARRFDVLIRETTPTPPNTFATAKFFDTRGEKVLGASQAPLMTAEIPIVISAA